MELLQIYRQFGISGEVCARGEAAVEALAPRFREIDRIAEANQAKVLLAMQRNRIGANHFAATTGYGYDDDGRERLEKVYAAVFHTEAALVRPQITCGTHALAIALSANLLSGDELLSPVGLPYDTLQEVIGIRPSPWTPWNCSAGRRRAWSLATSGKSKRYKSTGPCPSSSRTTARCCT